MCEPMKPGTTGDQHPHRSRPRRRRRPSSERCRRPSTSANRPSGPRARPRQCVAPLSTSLRAGSSVGPGPAAGARTGGARCGGCSSGTPSKADGLGAPKAQGPPAPSAAGPERRPVPAGLDIDASSSGGGDLRGVHPDLQGRPPAVGPGRVGAGRRSCRPAAARTREPLGSQSPGEPSRTIHLVPAPRCGHAAPVCRTVPQPHSAACAGESGGQSRVLTRPATGALAITRIFTRPAVPTTPGPCPGSPQCAAHGSRSPSIVRPGGGSSPGPPGPATRPAAAAPSPRASRSRGPASCRSSSASRRADAHRTEVRHKDAGPSPTWAQDRFAIRACHGHAPARRTGPRARGRRPRDHGTAHCQELAGVEAGIGVHEGHDLRAVAGLQASPACRAEAATRLGHDQRAELVRHLARIRPWTRCRRRSREADCGKPPEHQGSAFSSSRTGRITSIRGTSGAERRSRHSSVVRT